MIPTGDAAIVAAFARLIGDLHGRPPAGVTREDMLTALGTLCQFVDEHGERLLVLATRGIKDTGDG